MAICTRRLNLLDASHVTDPPQRHVGLTVVWHECTWKSIRAALCKQIAAEIFIVRSVLLVSFGIPEGIRLTERVSSSIIFNWNPTPRLRVSLYKFRFTADCFHEESFFGKTWCRKRKGKEAIKKIAEKTGNRLLSMNFWNSPVNIIETILSIMPLIIREVTNK